MTKRRPLLQLTFVLIVIMAIGWVIYGQVKNQAHRKQPRTPITVNQNPSPTEPSFNKDQYSLSDPTSIWVVVNKQRPLPDGFTPTDLQVPEVGLRLNTSSSEMKLRAVTASALEQLIAAAKKDDFTLILASGYRSYTYQQGVYGNYVKQDGQQAADRYSARPGFSEHQTGMAADIGRADHKCEVEDCFADTPESVWIAQHAHEYGFIIRYPKDKEAVTGYQYEPWHLRYVGKSLSNEMYAKSVTTLEEFFGLPAAPDYK